MPSINFSPSGIAADHRAGKTAGLPYNAYPGKSITAGGAESVDIDYPNRHYALVTGDA